MLSLWIPITIAAAFLQNLRSVMQKVIKGRLSTMGAAYARFFYAWPFAILYVAALSVWGGFALPEPNPVFLAWCFAGGLCQILFTVVLLWLFSFRSFAIGTVFSKLEIVLIAILGAVLLGDTVGPAAILAIVVGAAGTLCLAASAARLSFAGLLRDLGDRATLIGLLSAALLGASVVCFRGAALSLDGPDFVMAAGFTLAVALVMQTLMMGAWFAVFDRAEMVAVIREWRHALPVGVVGMVCSVCWFTAFTLQNAAYIRALGQVELIFAFLAGVFFFREPVSRSEIAGAILITGAILLILLAEVP
ncbi:MAG: DMT family transporter [Pseudomonadota bacterium]